VDQGHCRAHRKVAESRPIFACMLSRVSRECGGKGWMRAGREGSHLFADQNLVAQVDGLVCWGFVVNQYCFLFQLHSCLLVFQQGSGHGQIIVLSLRKARAMQSQAFGYACSSS
ncbi:hypothetical protein HaLaN_20293, partial [Haematococcus lacustris]